MTRVILADATHRDAWERFVAVHPDAAPYHRWAWHTAIQLAYGFAPVPLMALRGGTAVGVLPLVRLGLPGRHDWLISLPYCDFAGPLAEDKAVGQRLEEHALDLARTQGMAGVEMRQEAPGAAATPKVLMRLSLPGKSNELLSNFPAKLRSQIKKPQREGLRAASGGEELLEPFYKVFTKNMRDLGSPTHSLGWFREVIRGYGDKARVTVVYLPDGAACAAGITLVEGTRAFVPWASSLREHNRHNGNMLLYWSMLAQAAEAGLREFEFGRSTPGQGTHQFKKQWGASELGLAWTRHQTAAQDERPVVAATGKQRLRPLAEACWRRLPLPLANWAGPRLRRYISL